MTFLSKILKFTSIMPTTKVCFEYPASIKDVSNNVIARLSATLKISAQDHEEQCAVKVLFCPIVSRAGTDIESALARVSADKPTVMFVLHHTFDPEYNPPSSKRYDRDNLVMVDILYHEDSGLLKCSNNDEAFSKAEDYLKKYAEPPHVQSKGMNRAAGWLAEKTRPVVSKPQLKAEGPAII